MPVIKARHDHLKIYRPAGTPYANGRTEVTPELAVASAFVQFSEEFKRPPIQEKTTIEVLGVTGGWAATVLEITEPPDVYKPR